MKILIVGATGRTGKHLVKQALAQGHQVTALARKPRRLRVKHQRLQVVKGDVLDEASLQPAVSGQEAVICALGMPWTRKPTTLFWEGTANLIRAMQNGGVRRLVCITGVGVGDSRGHGGFFFERIIRPFFLRTLYEDKERQEELIRSTDLEWIMVRPARLTNGRPRGSYLILTDLTAITAKKIARADLAEFVLRQLTEKRYLHEAPLVTY